MHIIYNNFMIYYIAKSLTFIFYTDVIPTATYAKSCLKITFY